MLPLLLLCRASGSSPGPATAGTCLSKVIGQVVRVKLPDHAQLKALRCAGAGAPTVHDQPLAEQRSFPYVCELNLARQTATTVMVVMR
jgi:hypothetical protein